MAKLDYLKTTSFDETIYGAYLGLCQNHFGCGMPFSVQGYTGFKTDHSFVGKGVCLDAAGFKKPHVLASISGSTTPDIARYVRHWRKDLSIKRVDLQLTVECLFDYEKVFRLLNEKLNVKLVKSKLTTLYIGSRFSNRFIRIYEKEKGLNRFEIEYKNELAEGCFTVFEDFKLNELFLSEVMRIVKKFPHLADDFYPFVEKGVKEYSGIKVKRPTSTETNLEYYAKNVRPYLWRLLRNPEYAEVVGFDLDTMAKQSSFFEEDRVFDLDTKPMPRFRGPDDDEERGLTPNGKRVYNNHQ